MIINESFITMADYTQDIIISSHLISSHLILFHLLSHKLISSPAYLSMSQAMSQEVKSFQFSSAHHISQCDSVMQAYLPYIQLSCGSSYKLQPQENLTAVVDVKKWSIICVCDRPINCSYVALAHQHQLNITYRQRYIYTCRYQLMWIQIHLKILMEIHLKIHIDNRLQSCVLLFFTSKSPCVGY